MIITSLLLLLLYFVSICHADDSLCPAYMQMPYNETELVGGEFWCPKHYGDDICYSCCRSHNSVCCDDGSCMDYDEFCRYPTSCCEAPYCGDECCSLTHGLPCGPVCAPRLGYVCCNATSGDLCATPDFCCNGATCCGQHQHCCESNICCDQGEICCEDRCCPLGYDCCGNGKCCPSTSYCFPDGSCCPHGQVCNHVNNSCCALGTHCSDDGTICCPDGQFGCGSTCCGQSYTCCDGKCCPKEVGCAGTGCCPVKRACGPDNCCEPGDLCCPNSPSHHCCPQGMMCCHDHCCPADTNYCGPHGECCPTGVVACGGHCCDPGEACINDNHHTDYCCKEGQYCQQTGICCPVGFYCDGYGYCCQDGTTFCYGGAKDACYTDPYSVCCQNKGIQDGTACTVQAPQCIYTKDFGNTPSKRACCPANTNTICANECLPQDPNTCQCCRDSPNCCYAPYTCHSDGSCVHDYTTSGPWWCWGCGTLGIGPACCKHHHDAQPGLGGVPAIPRGIITSKEEDGRGLSFYMEEQDDGRHSRAFLSYIKSPRNTKEETHRRALKQSTQFVDLPPPPTHKVNPASYPCFNNPMTLNSTCDAWICLEEIANCGVFGYLDRQHELFCTDFARLGNLFNPAGQIFLNCTANCVTLEHVDMFMHGFKPCCTSMEAWGQEQGRNDCIIGCNFCVVYLSNVVGFTALFDLLSPGVLVSDIYHHTCTFGR